MDDRDRELMTDQAEQLDELYDRVESTLPHCPIHPKQVVYIDGGCQECARARKNDPHRNRRRARRRA